MDPETWALTPVVIRDPSWTDVEAAVRRLDNARFTDVSLSFDEGKDRTSMLLSGGRDDRVICCVARPDDPAWDQAFRYVVDSEWQSGEFMQVIGGQGSDLPASLSVKREVALAAARYFFEQLALDPSLAWEVH